MRVVLALLMSVLGARAYRVGIVGGGVVGGGIVEIVKKRGLPVDIKRVCVRDLNKPRDWKVPEGCELVDDVAKVVDADDIDLVVEVAGGVTQAKDIVFGALSAGKDVVTANKALIAAHLAELESAVESADGGRDGAQRGVQFGLEAAVMGGIPIIHSLQNDFVGDHITEMQGIMNGCTNFMLCKMETTGCSYTDVLKEAQELGYAEADPTLDVGGQDARSKLKILIKLAFGMDIEEDAIPCAGITQISSTDFDYAKLEGGTIKLLGISKLDAGDKLSCFVSPAFVPSSATLASVSGATNAIEIKSDNLGSTLLVGQGAGRYPTANSCVSDIMRAAVGSCPGERAFLRTISPPQYSFEPDYRSKFYLRCNYKDQLGITRTLGEQCDNNGVSIFSMMQLPGVDSFVVFTEEVQLSAIKRVAAALAKEEWCLGEPFIMPVLE